MEVSPSSMSSTIGETRSFIVTVKDKTFGIHGVMNLSAENLQPDASIRFKPGSGAPPFISVDAFSSDLQGEGGALKILINESSKDKYASAMVRSNVSYSQTRENGLAIVYYGWLIKDEEGRPSEAALRIANLIDSEDLLVAPFYTEDPRYVNLSPQVLSLVQSKGAKVFAYVDTRYGTRPLKEVLREVDEYLLKGIDGIFFDCAPNLQNGDFYSYYATLYKRVKAYGSEKMVILNTGLSDRWTDEAIMAVTDILCVEHQWTSEAGFGSVWAKKYPASRFMGLSEGVIDGEDAKSLTKQAWDQGVGFHYSTRRYVSLEAWGEDYIRFLRRE